MLPTSLISDGVRLITRLAVMDVFCVKVEKWDCRAHHDTLIRRAPAIAPVSRPPRSSVTSAGHDYVPVQRGPQAYPNSSVDAANSLGQP